MEDDPAARTLTVRVLQQLGYRILGSVDGEEALQTVEAHEGPIDLVLTEVMPQMSGAELVERFNAIRQNSGCSTFRLYR